MWNSPALILAHILVLGASSPLTQEQSDCLTLSTVTILQPTTIYIPSPSPSSESSRTTLDETPATAWASSTCDEETSFTTVPAIRSTSIGFSSSKTSTSSIRISGSSRATGSTRPTSSSWTTNSLKTNSSFETTSSFKTSSFSKTTSSLKATSSLETTSWTTWITTTVEKSTTPIGTPVPTARTFKNIVYFTNWGIYGRNYQPQDLPVDQLTHVLHAFANIDRQDGTVFSTDPYADLEKRYAGDSWGEEPGRHNNNNNNNNNNNAYGIVKQLYLQKKRHRHLKTLLSIGGWTFSRNFMPMASAEAGRRTFARSAVALMSDWGLDGIDIDWEYPQSAAEAAHYVLLLEACRAALDDYAARNDIKDSSSGRPYHFLLTVATAAGPGNYETMDLKGMDKHLDSWHLMSYDYTGSWSDVTGHASNLFFVDNADNNNKTTPYSTDAAVQHYLAQGIRPDKILLGLPVYGRAFGNTAGLGEPYSGVGWTGSSSGTDGSWEAGVWDYKVLPRPGATEHYDDVAKAAYSYGSGELISYDNVRSATDKASYIREQRGLGGAFFWEASADRTDDRSLVKTMAARLGNLEVGENNLRYPTSQYDNIRNGMPS